MTGPEDIQRAAVAFAKTMFDSRVIEATREGDALGLAALAHLRESLLRDYRISFIRGALEVAQECALTAIARGLDKLSGAS